MVQAQIKLESAHASAINNGILRVQYEYAIVVLLRRPHAYFSLKTHSTLPPIPLHIPCNLLERIPDIAQA